MPHKKYSPDMNARGGSRAAATSKLERFVIIVSGFQALIIIAKRSILDVAAILPSWAEYLEQNREIQ